MSQKTQTLPQKTAVPEKTAIPEKTAAMLQKTLATLIPANDPVPVQAAHKEGDVITLDGKDYTVEKVLSSGAEGDLYQVSSKGKRYALKLCHKGYQTNEKALKALEKMKDRDVHLPKIAAFGPDYELMEFFPEGSAANAQLKGNAAAITAIAVKIAICLDLMHKAGVLHKDVKPANILIRDGASWDCVLCDFGISDLLDKDGRSISLQVRTPIYAAPELYHTDNTITNNGKTYAELTGKADFYSLGMTILSLWMGEGAFKAGENQLAMAKTKGRIAIPADMPDPLATIVRGLLIKDPSKRWDLPEIEKALNGEPVTVDEDQIIEDLGIVYNATKHLRADTPEELSQCMADDLDLARKYLYRGQIERWLKPYPELALEIHDIVEKRFPMDQDMGVFAAMFLLNPASPLPMSGTSRTTGEHVERDVRTFKEVANFCNQVIPDDETVELISSGYFVEWVRPKSKDIASKLPKPYGKGDYVNWETALLRVQTLDPLSDINLINDPSNPDYAMTGEGLGRFLNMVYTNYWNAAMGSEFSKQYKRKVIPAVDKLIARNFQDPEDNHYITSFLDTKGSRFRDQRSWFVYCTDYNSEDYRNKCGPKDRDFRMMSSWMKVIKGFGWTPEYVFTDSGDVETDLDGIFSHSTKELRNELRSKGLRGFLAVHHQEDPDEDLGSQFAYEALLWEYLEDIRKIDSSDNAVMRFDLAADEANRLIRRGRGRIGSLTARSIGQTVMNVVLGVLPCLLMLTMLVMAIIEHPLVDVSGIKVTNFMWVFGAIAAAVAWFYNDTNGCLVPVIVGVITAFLLTLLVKLLGMFILYIYAAIVLAVLVFFSIKVLFFKSPFASKARKFTKPGFEEKVLEPLYFAFGTDDSFDSSLNGAFNDDDIDSWKADLKMRRRNSLVFVGVVWILMIFSFFIPKSSRVETILHQKEETVIEEVTPVKEPAKADVKQKAKPATKAKSTPKPETKPETKPAAKPQPKQESKPAQDTKPKPIQRTPPPEDAQSMTLDEIHQMIQKNKTK